MKLSPTAAHRTRPRSSNNREGGRNIDSSNDNSGGRFNVNAQGCFSSCLAVIIIIRRVGVIGARRGVPSSQGWG